MSRRVLVTGGSSGLGAALVAEFVARGDRVLVADLNAPVDHSTQLDASPDARRAVTRRNSAEFLRLDVTSDADWDVARRWTEEHWGGLDVLVNNAGIATGGRIDVATIDEWQQVVDINLLGVVRGCRTFVPLLKAQVGDGQEPGQIVNTASLAGLVHPPAMSSYTAVKAGVVALSETLAYELDPWGISVSAVCPGFFRTNLASSLHGSDSAMDRIAARLIDRARLTAPEVAAEVMKGIDARRMVIVPDAAARKAVLTKRFARPLYDREQRAFARRIHALTTKETS